MSYITIQFLIPKDGRRSVVVCERMQNLNMVNSCDKHSHTLPDSSAEVDIILHI